MNNVVLVHGGFVDGSGWEGVYKTLTRNGYSVTVVQNPTMSLEDDVAHTKRALAAKDGPAILVGHSYGGAVITEAGNDPKVTGLVYITAFAPDKGESVATHERLATRGAGTADIAAARRLFVPRQGRVHATFAADVDPKKPRHGGLPSAVGRSCSYGKISEPAWRAKPSWYLIATEDKAIPPDAQRAMSKRAGSTVVEVKAATPCTSRNPMLSLR